MFSFTTLSMGLAAFAPLVLGAVHDIQVGDTGLEYSPQAISAQPGDQVVFHFHPKNHTVSQSSFADPCGLKDGGFHSGFMPVAANVSMDALPTFTVSVNDTSPIWVYCGQAAGTPASHCGAGMVFAINCGADGSPNSFTNFKNSALAIGAALSSSAAAASTVAAPPPAQSNNAAPTVTDASPTVTAAYGGYTVPPAPAASVVTAAITLDSTSVWTTVYTSFENSPAATPVAAEGAVHTVVVGGTGKLFFDPANITAAPRDTVVFQFQQKNHSVVQSSFPDPCRPLNAGNSSAPQAFISDFFAVPDNSTDFPTFSITVNDTTPIWAYCRQKAPTSHCGAGMVFSINAIESGPRNFAAFQALAEQLNGTAAAALASPSSTGTPPPNGAPSLRVPSALMLLGLVAAFL
ncbi:hypothetical protein FB45DRAFT_833974 [Roridomyces roridus]|jgi:plastocyanin|uniref:Cupredoxin n=1 Tax=Roridomyces roridus TaxID=1738132 RepID=A0AAD7BUV8_9AGAR|nr:hypothetical protein FB45DRAFT_833974 [Roridomyces roridus]